MEDGVAGGGTVAPPLVMVWDLSVLVGEAKGALVPLLVLSTAKVEAVAISGGEEGCCTEEEEEFFLPKGPGIFVKERDGMEDTSSRVLAEESDDGAEISTVVESLDVFLGREVISKTTSDLDKVPFRC